MKTTSKSIFCLLLFVLFPAMLFTQSNWGPDVRLTFFWGYSYDPRAACCGDTIHLVWWESYAHEEVFYKRSTDAGETWGPDVRLSEEDTHASVLPQITVSGSIVHVIWYEWNYNGLLYRRSTNSGGGWENIDTIVPCGVHSSIDAFGDTVYVCGITGTTGDLLFTKSFNNGNNWEPIQTITPAHDSPTLRIISNNGLHIGISYERVPEIYAICSFDGGESWCDSQLVSEGIASGSQRPVMDVDTNQDIHVTWYDYKYSPYFLTGDIFYSVSHDSGSTWEPIDSLTTQHRAVASDILAEGNNLHLVWEDDRNDFSDNFEIYYRMSTDLGQTWGQEVRLTDAVNWSRTPSLACDGNYLHLFWSDQRDDPHNHVGEIYYKRKDLSQGAHENYATPCIPKGIMTSIVSGPLILPLGKNCCVYDITGRVVLPEKAKPGIYFIEIDGKIQQKVIKIK